MIEQTITAVLIVVAIVSLAVVCGALAAGCAVVTDKIGKKNQESGDKRDN